MTEKTKEEPKKWSKEERHYFLIGLFLGSILTLLGAETLLFLQYLGYLW